MLSAWHRGTLYFSLLGQEGGQRLLPNGYVPHKCHPIATAVADPCTPCKGYQEAGAGLSQLRCFIFTTGLPGAPTPSSPRSG